MAKEILTSVQRRKQDEMPDELFYSQPRFVNHLDKNFRSRLTELYRHYLRNDFIVLDLMSSWVSHLPNNVKYKRVIGHGMNSQELISNKRLDEYWVQNFNINTILPLESETVDCILIVAGWQYLQKPEQIAEELFRILSPRGKIIISFSNRAFWSKAPRIWTETSIDERIEYIISILANNSFVIDQVVKEVTANLNIFSLFNNSNDPFISVIASKK